MIIKLTTQFPIYVYIKVIDNGLRGGIFNTVKSKGGCYLFLSTKGYRNGYSHNSSKV